MKIPWDLMGNIAGFGGLVTGLGAVAARIAGHYHLAEFESLTIFQGAVGLLAAGCFFMLKAIAAR